MTFDVISKRQSGFCLALFLRTCALEFMNSHVGSPEQIMRRGNIDTEWDAKAPQLLQPQLIILSTQVPDMWMSKSSHDSSTSIMTATADKSQTKLPSWPQSITQTMTKIKYYNCILSYLLWGWFINQQYLLKQLISLLGPHFLDYFASKDGHVDPVLIKINEEICWGAFGKEFVFW